MIEYTQLKQNRRKFLALTGLTVKEFEGLVVTAEGRLVEFTAGGKRYFSPASHKPGKDKAYGEEDIPSLRVTNMYPDRGPSLTWDDLTQEVAELKGVGMGFGDGLKSERYSATGEFLGVLNDVGFMRSDFSSDGKLMFGAGRDERMFALRTRDLQKLWTGNTRTSSEENMAVKYSLE